MKYISLFVCALAFAGCVSGERKGAVDPAAVHPVSDRVGTHENQDWLEFRGYHYTDSLRRLPRVLLIGDSISGQYRAGVRDAAEGLANVTWLTSCYCVSTDNFFKYLEIALDDADYAVVHFNNGLHSFRTDPGDYERGLRKAYAMIRAKQPKAKIVWTRSTPVADAWRMKKVVLLNSIGDRVAAEAGVAAVDDLDAALCAVPADRRWLDGCHVPDEGKAALVASVLRSLGVGLGIDFGDPAVKAKALRPVSKK